MFEGNVQRGVALLDTKNPDWRKKIDPEILDLNECTLCILGQLYGHYIDGVNELYMVYVAEGGCNNRTVWAAEHGFNLLDGEDDELIWSILRDSWLAEL